MEKTYYFNLRLKGNAQSPVLSVSPTSFWKKPIPYPIDFVELNIPITVDNKNYFGMRYSLEFEHIVNEKGNPYDLTTKEKLKRILSELEELAYEDIMKALRFEAILKKKFKLTLEVGLGERERGKLGNPKIGRSGNGQSN